MPVLSGTFSTRYMKRLKRGEYVHRASYIPIGMQEILFWFSRHGSSPVNKRKLGAISLPNVPWMPVSRRSIIILFITIYYYRNDAFRMKTQNEIMVSLYQIVITKQA
jgi:hypothetical protein